MGCREHPPGSRVPEGESGLRFLAQAVALRALRAFAGWPVTWGDERRSNSAGVSGSARFFPSLQRAQGKRHSGTRLPPAAFFRQLDTVFSLMEFLWPVTGPRAFRDKDGEEHLSSVTGVTIAVSVFWRPHREEFSFLCVIIQ